MLPGISECCRGAHARGPVKAGGAVSSCQGLTFAVRFEERFGGGDLKGNSSKLSVRLRLQGDRLLSENGRRRLRDAQEKRVAETGGVGGQIRLGGGAKNTWGDLTLNWGRRESQEGDTFNYQALLTQHRERCE
ncbi:hypothetical protein O3P69_007533 [Scylla paramamosain]|uniref:Uncharacterized protein n=1 Tax=Scylla paramamosain TaxID=85552 RepID=A0AAW0UX74_SCYPA